MRKALIILVLIGLLSGCSAKPSDVSQDTWDKGIQFTILINTLVTTKEKFPDGLAIAIGEFANPNDLSTRSEKEKEILNTIKSLASNSLLTVILGQEASEKYQDDYKKLENIFGKTNLDTSKLNSDEMAKILATAAIKKKQDEKKSIEEYMKKNNIQLTAKDVQFDMVNNLEKQFVVAGTAELDDYYNYGFDDSIEKDYFVVNVTPVDGTFSDRWYLYLHRESFQKLFNELKQSNVSIIATCEIPKYRYKNGQGNMARVKSVSW